MNSTEVAKLCRYVAAMCPAQKFDEATPDAWTHVLRDVRIEDARVAVVELAKRQPFIAPSEIIAEVRRIRARRIDAVTLDPPAEVASDTAGYLRWLRRSRRAVANGWEPPVEALEPAQPGRIRELVAAASPRTVESGAQRPVSRDETPNPGNHPTPTSSVDTAPAGVTESE